MWQSQRIGTKRISKQGAHFQLEQSKRIIAKMEEMTNAEFPNCKTEDQWDEKIGKKQYYKRSTALTASSKESPTIKHDSTYGKLLRRHVLVAVKYAAPYVDRDQPVFSRLAVLTYLSEIWGVGRKCKNVKLFACLVAEQFTSYLFHGIQGTDEDKRKLVDGLNIERDTEDVFVLLHLWGVCSQSIYWDKLRP